jgi:tetratricopeptide (TPR) repeat protein
LATSRELLGVRDEQLWPVSPIDTDAAVELFVDRCRQRDPRFELDSEILASVKEIGVRLDGIPLALELAAARTTALSPTAIAERLDDRFRLLRGGRRGERHQTLRDTLQWSYDLLNPAEAALFDRLAVFAGSFTLETAEAVCADDDLVDKSMVQRDRESTGRFTLLETLRQFGEEQLYSKEAVGEYRDRHARYFCQVAVAGDARIFGADEREVWGILDAEWDNLRAAVFHLIYSDDIDRALALVLALYFFAMNDMRFELGDWAGRLLEHPAASAHPDAMSASGVRAWHAWSRGDIVGAARLLDEAAERRDMDPALYLGATLATLELGDLVKAQATADLLLEFVDQGSPRSRYCAAVMQPYTLMAAHRFEEAVSWAEQALAIATEAASPSCIAHSLHVRGLVRHRESPAAAREDSQRAFDIAVSVNPRHLIAEGATGTIARIAAFGDDLPEALRRSRDAIAFAAGAHYLASLAVQLQHGALVLFRAGDSQTAKCLLQTTRRHGYRSIRRIESAIADELQLIALNDETPDHMTMLDAAQLAIDAIDAIAPISPPTEVTTAG